MKIGSFFLILIVLAVVPIASADGLFFRPNYYSQDILQPEQKALVIQDGNIERLIIQVNFEGRMDDFAWIVPVPSIPEIKKADPQIFLNLNRQTEPNIIQSPLKIAFFPIGILAFMPAASLNSVNVISEKQVGIFATAVLSSSDPKALEEWLRKNNYAIPEGSGELFKYYVDKGWYFVAARISLAPFDESLLNSLKKIDERINSKGTAKEILTELIVDGIKNKKL